MYGAGGYSGSAEGLFDSQVSIWPVPTDEILNASDGRLFRLGICIAYGILPCKHA